MIKGQEIEFQEDRFWSVKRATPYRIVGIVLIVPGGFALLLPILHTAPWWVYILPLTLLIPGLIIAGFSEGITIDAGAATVEKWWNVWSLGRCRKMKLADYNALYMASRASSSGRVHSIVCEVFLLGDRGKEKVFMWGDKEGARAELGRIAVLTGFPETDPPTGEFDPRMLIMVIFLVLGIPLLGLILFFILRTFH
jgi:hypothetical protein